MSHSESKRSDSEGLKRMALLSSSFGASINPPMELRVCEVGCVGGKWYLQRGEGLVKNSGVEIQQRCPEAAELGVGMGGTPGFR